MENEVLYYHTDQVGSTVAVTNQAQQDVLWVQYDAHGAVTEGVSPTQRDGKPAVRPGLNQVADKLQRALSVTPYLYCGEHGVMTDRTGLIHMRARYYHPGLRRFVNPDPIGFAGGMNWYGYAGGSPVVAVDPEGTDVLYLYGADTANPDYFKNAATSMQKSYNNTVGYINAWGYFETNFAWVHSGKNTTDILAASERFKNVNITQVYWLGIRKTYGETEQLILVQSA